MAVQYLRKHDLPVPDDLQEKYASSVLAWLHAIESLDHDELETHKVSHTGASADGTTAYLPPDELPEEAQLSPADCAILRSAELWTSLPSPARELLTMRMAVSFVREDYGGWVPSGLVSRTIAAAGR